MHAISESIQQTVQDFRSGCSEWEDEVLQLFDDVTHAVTMGKPADGPTVSASVAQDVAGLKGLVEQQTEVLAALVHALAGSSATVESPSAGDEHVRRESNPDFDPFERLQQAVAAASEAN